MLWCQAWVLTWSLAALWQGLLSRAERLLEDSSSENAHAIAEELTTDIGIKQLAVGDMHTCALTSTNMVKCWGLNSHHQAGVQHRTGIVPLPMSQYVPLGKVGKPIAVSAGGHRSCVVMELSSRAGNNIAMCWGDKIKPEPNAEIASQVPFPPRGVKQVVVNSNILCATLIDGTVWCSSPPSKPFRLILPGRVDKIALGIGTEVCVVLTNGGGQCWQVNVNAQKLRQQTYAVQGAVKSLVSSVHKKCALFKDGVVQCQKAKVEPNAIYLPVDLNEKATEITAGSSHFCVLLQNQALQCWGSDVTDANAALRSLQEDGKHAVGVVSNLGADHTCALLKGGYAKCWGHNDKAQLGSLGYINPALQAVHPPMRPSSAAPVPIPGPTQRPSVVEKASSTSPTPMTTTTSVSPKPSAISEIACAELALSNQKWAPGEKLKTAKACLGFDSSAKPSEAEVKKAYHKALFAWHPDKRRAKAKQDEESAHKVFVGVGVAKEWLT